MKRETGLTAKQITQSKKRIADNFDKLSFFFAQASGHAAKTFDFTAKVEKSLTNAKISEVTTVANRMPEKFVLVTDFVTAPQAERLKDLNVCYLDAAGNAFLRAENLYVYVTGKKAATKREKPLKLFRAAGIKLLFYFLTEPGLENKNYREIEKLTGTPRTTVSQIMNDLKTSGFLVSRGGGKGRSLIRKEELLKRWVEGYGEQLRPKLLLNRFKSDKRGTRWWEEINIKDYRAEWSGEIAGDSLTKHLKPELVTIYGDSILPKLQLKAGLRRSEKGEVEILKRFWKTDVEFDTAPPLIVYADLMNSTDGRNIETAEMIYERYLAGLTRETA